MHINLESSIYIKSHPLLSEKDDIKEKYLTIFSYFIGNYTDDSDWSNELINLYHKYFDVNLNLSSNLNIIKQNVNELCTWKYQNKRAAYYKILLVQDLLYYFDIQESSKTEKAMNELGDIFEDFFKEDYQIILNAALKNNLVISEIENYWKKVIINLQKTHKKNALNYVIKLIILAGLVWWPFIGLFVAAIYSFIVKENIFLFVKKV